ncbi:oxidoreductase [Nocardioides marmoriginsengisoli]|uniref:Oxidoreductase n=1 Tax=Nocardioides marmoriginsengisoli TaxID=661483 RepID=A0A3N0CP24_9ACTN|nr:PDR/VanB family oxidoreductase [Nocardioides marmoriginsengisoli]RNL65079.1 oxidoreductase [Nocardioides marmoriginsengisoli]
MSPAELVAVPDEPALGLAFRATARLVAVYERISAVSGRFRPEVVAVDRDLPAVVHSVRREADGVVGLELRPRDREHFPAWEPGCHLDLVLPSGAMRQYSLTGDPADLTSYRIAVRRIPGGGGGSIEAHGLAVGDAVVLRGPRNAFPFIEAPGYLFVAGGIGITPILPMIREAVARGDDWAFVYTGRSVTTMPFLAEVERLATEHPGRVYLRPDDLCGLPNAEDILAAAPPAATVYACGPPAMVDAIRAAVPSERVGSLHHERFSALPVRGGEPFTVRLHRSGRTVEVAGDETVLTALRREIPAIAYSCQQGFCGTCPVEVLAGTPIHRDRCLTDQQREHRLAVCVSRAEDELVLDL